MFCCCDGDLCNANFFANITLPTTTVLTTGRNGYTFTESIIDCYFTFGLKENHIIINYLTGTVAFRDGRLCKGHLGTSNYVQGLLDVRGEKSFSQKNFFGEK